MLKWNETYVAFSEDGQYKLEVDEGSMYGWDWTLYELEDEDWNYLCECESPLESHFEAKREGERELERILAEDKKLEAEREKQVGFSRQALMKHALEHLDIWKAGNPYLARIGMNSVARGESVPSLADFWAPPAPTAVERLVDAAAFAAEQPLAGQHGTSYLICSDCDLWSFDRTDTCGACATADGPDPLEENVKRLIEEAQNKELKLGPVLCMHCHMPMDDGQHNSIEYEGIKITSCPQVAKGGSGYVYGSKGFTALHSSDFAKVKAEVQPQSGYEQILAEIKRESNDVEL